MEPYFALVFSFPLISQNFRTIRFKWVRTNTKSLSTYTKVDKVTQWNDLGSKTCQHLAYMSYIYWTKPGT